ncbi:hypothetical protein [Streptomyces sp. NPDC088725]|uniref:hypothetical protein n=1 Tax=Streptomyces sp. NPDC088725 TaxID=3365873 RepID=UPI0038190FB1
MNPRSLPAAAALIASASLLLTACGGSDNDNPKTPDKIAGADQSNKPPASPSPSPSPTSAAGRPTFTFPEDISYTFDWPKTGDATKDAVLADAEQFIRAEDYAIVKQDPLDKGYRLYTEGKMAASSQSYIQAYVDEGKRITGKYRYYKASVTVSGPTQAALVYCQDQAKAFDMSVKTQKIYTTPVNADSYVIYHTAMKKNQQGIWVTTELFSERGSAECQP